MNKRDLARVLIRVVGVWFIAYAIPNVVAALIMAWWTFGTEMLRGQVSMSLQGLLAALLQLIIGLALFYRGGWVAKRLLHVDELRDV